MPWRDLPAPIAMRRIAVVAPTRRWRTVLVAMADSGMVEPEESTHAPGIDGWATTPAAVTASGGPLPTAEPPDMDALRTAGRAELVAGEAELQRVSDAALQRDQITALAGWAPAAAIEPLAERLAPLGGSVVEMPDPVGVDVPTALPPRRSSGALRPLVDTYATVPYRDVDPVWFATVAYVVMFGMMFGDVGDGLVLVVGALLLRRTQRPRLARVRHLWPLIVALGAMAAVFGLLYGEAFGPTGLVPTRVDRSPRRARDAAAGRSVCRRGPARVRVCDRHRQSLARGRRQRGVVGTQRRSRSHALRRCRARGGRRPVVIAAAVGGRPRDRHHRSRARRGGAAKPGRPGRRRSRAGRGRDVRPDHAHRIEPRVVRPPGRVRSHARGDRVRRVGRDEETSGDRGRPRRSPPSWSSRSVTWWRSRSRRSWWECRRCVSSTTSCSPGSSSARAARSGRGTFPSIREETRC